jgi:hypothetical protein
LDQFAKGEAMKEDAKNEEESIPYETKTSIGGITEASAKYLINGNPSNFNLALGMLKSENNDSEADWGRGVSLNQLIFSRKLLETC